MWKQNTHFLTHRYDIFYIIEYECIINARLIFMILKQILVCEIIARELLNKKAIFIPIMIMTMITLFIAFSFFIFVYIISILYSLICGCVSFLIISLLCIHLQ